jgi:hypothetical protein
LRQEDQELEDSLGYTANLQASFPEPVVGSLMALVLKKQKIILATWEAEIWRGSCFKASSGK